ncbi:oxidoreductase [Pullulanibacillus camelliae]|uniref:Oxidoreductase n=1 Tax=Pullulanibacillus camelliae TaxID=1707096 RepID=A0A8J2VMJ0_9BACL|nr:SDR family oxidoreductase [Pullulanibacillus camelliae]GGE33399.1 oxidoreductase [Pullulanibacillus camelliae]
MTEQSNKIAIVTGGSRGIGRSTVLSLAKRGIDSIFTYHSNQEEAKKVVALVQETGQKAMALQLDTTNISTFDAFVKNVEKALGELGVERFDFLVNNAGTSHHNTLEKTTEEELDRLYEVHFKGVFFLTQQLLPLINDGGRIVNISTGLTRFVVPGSGAYASMKGAIEILTRYMAKELGARGIAVNTVAPGPIATDFSGLRTNEELKKGLGEMTALGRVGEPNDVAEVIVSLLSNETHWVNAQRIEVSGGMSL